MKTTKNILILITIAFFTFSNSLYAQLEHIITLNVDTGRIVKHDVNMYCNFGQENDVSNEDYTITVNIGDTIVWQGVSIDAPETDIVNITSINHHGGTNIFGVNTLHGNEETPELVVGEVLKSTVGENKKIYKYIIKFTVFNNGKKRNGTFQIDPKISVNQ